MKIAISTLPFPKHSLEEVIDICQKAKYDALEIRMDLHDWSKPESSDAHYEAVRDKIHAAGLKVIDLGSSARVRTYNPDDIVEMKRLFEIGNILGSTGIRIMIGPSRKEHETMEGPLPVELDGLCQYMREIDVLAEEMGQEVWIETHKEYELGIQMKGIYDNCDLKHVKIIWDVLHTIEGGETLEETMEYIGEYIVHIHVKDAIDRVDPVEKRGWIHTRMGDGIFPTTELVKIMTEAGYDGYYSLEWESTWRKDLRDLNCDEEEIAGFPAYMRSFELKG